MDFKDYYDTLGVAPGATQDQIKRAYRKLARKFHPDVSKEPDAEARFKDVAEAHEALIDPERRAAYDALLQRHARGEPIDPPPGWQGRSAGGGDADQAFSEFFEAMFGQRAQSGAGGARPPRGPRPVPGDDQRGGITISLDEAFAGAQRTVSLRLPVVDGSGRSSLRTRQLEVRIPVGVRSGQQLRLAGQGGPGQGGAPAGDLFLEVQIAPHPVFRIDQRDLYFDLPLAPWEAALGASVAAPTPQGAVQLTIPPGSLAGRQLRLKGRGLPGTPAGDLYAVLGISLPPAATPAEQGAYSALALAFPDFKPRLALPA